MANLFFTGFIYNMISAIQYNTPSFQARCPQIREGQKVCHLISSQLPHISDTRLRSAYYNLFDKGLGEKVNIRYIKWMRSMIDKIEEARNLYVNNAYGHTNGKPTRILNQLKFEHLGNCYENGKAAEIILKLNGVENARAVSLKRGSSAIDHFVCVFNRDGSAFDGTIKNNQTIIVDPWLGKADFAGNMFKIYENTCQKLLKLPEQGKFGVRNVEDIKISENDSSIIKQYFPKLFYKK